MDAIESLSQVFAELGPQLEEIEQIEQLGEDAWLVIFDEEAAITVTAEVASNKLCFSMLLAAVDEKRAAEIYPTLLTYSYLKSETGGFHFGMDGRDGNVHLMLDLGHLDLDANELAAVLVGMLDTGETWREAIIFEKLPEGGEEESAAGAEGESAAGIQV